MKILLALVLGLLPAQLWAAELRLGGRVFTEEGPLAGARVEVYRSAQDLSSGKPLAVAGASDSRGRYALSLAPGRYFFAARGRSGDREFFAYYGNNPVKVEQDGIWLGFMAHEVKPPLVTPEKGTLSGSVTFKGAPVADAYVTLYKQGAQVYKGLGFKTEPARGDGSFTLPVVPGVYTVVAKKAQGERRLRPLVKGDLFCYYPHNPVEVKSDAGIAIEIPCYPVGERQAFAAGEELLPAGYTPVDRLPVPRSGIRGKVTDAAGKPLAGMPVLVFAAEHLMHHLGDRADFTGLTDRDGAYFIPVDRDGDYHVAVRNSLGHSHNDDEIFIVYKRESGKPLTFRAGAIIDHVDFVVAGREDERPPVEERRPAGEGMGE
jgi:hypothetical protein